MFSSLSPVQRTIVFEKSGRFVVRACPGSGKTFCVGARLARLLHVWKESYNGIATVSFTNVAWKEIEKGVKEQFGMQKGVSFPHFLGTIDSFINKYVFLPFGHLVMNCKKRPILVGEPHGSWTGSDYSTSFFDNISFNKDGSMYALKSRRMTGDWKNNRYIVNAKLRLNKAGYATQADANYFAMKILKEYPSIAKVISKRFPFLIVDEAQDTSEIQMTIIDLLVENGLSEVMLVGDPDQAIFEWNRAKPELLINKFSRWDGSIQLNENRRSSKKICNFTFNLSSLPQPSEAVSLVKDFNFVPTVMVYKDDVTSLIETYLGICRDNNILINKSSVAVIYRAKEILNKITGIKEVPYDVVPWVEGDYVTKGFVRGKFLFDKGDYMKGFKYVEQVIVQLISKGEILSKDANYLAIEKVGFSKLHEYIFKVLNILPDTNILLGDWIQQANNSLKKIRFNVELKVTTKGKLLTFEELFLREQVMSSKVDYRLGTVHSVKGETFDATLLILKERASNKGKYINMLTRNPLSAHEELRIVYVGMTRPRKVLMLGVPNEEIKRAWDCKLLP
jgi:DNA helicase II / ATP-dependent DNA helicase PcrA